MTTRTIAVVSAGLQQPSSTSLLAERLAGAATRALQQRGVAARIETVELREHAHDLTNNLLTFFATEQLEAAKQAVAEADGVVAVSPIYSGSYNGLFKTFFDVLEPETLEGTPVLLGATAGTARHSLAIDHAMRPLFAYLRALVVPTGVFAASEDWGASDEFEGALDERIERAAAEFADLLVARGAKVVVDPFDEPTPFAQLLDDV